ncbi:hypothetical protein A2U01_0087388, partial [Trifolium medium]|nr:hypothetical protein [Trifolium medium]
MSLTPLQDWSLYSPQRWAKALDGNNDHQVVAGKRLESHDEQLMFIIPMSAVTIWLDIATVEQRH